jgi:small subunit ribosomal protein S21
MSKGNGVEVQVNPGERIESALRRYKSQLEKAGILDILQRREYYLKPSAAKKEKKKLRKKTNNDFIDKDFNE